MICSNAILTGIGVGKQASTVQDVAWITQHLPSQLADPQRPDALTGSESPGCGFPVFCA